MVKTRTKKMMLREWLKASTYDSVRLRGGRWSSRKKTNSSSQENRTHSNQGTQWGVTVLCKQRGERAQICSSRSLAAAAETREMPQEVQRNWGSQQALPLKGELHQSCFLVPISTPLPSSLHWAQQSPAPPAPWFPAVGAAGHPCSFKPNRDEPGAFSKLSSTCTTQTLSPLAAPAPMDSEKLWLFWI